MAREEQEAIQQTATPISESLRQKIELEIVSGNFQAVEAQINQLLKQDNSQHELYLFLLDIHLAQKDDFAIDQLIKHINALKLDDIVQIAETKQREYQKNKQPDAIEFSINSKNFHQVSSLNDTKNQNNDSDFDSLTQSNTIQSFDDLQSEFATPTETEKDIEIKSSIEPLDFSFSFEQKETAEPVIEIETKSSPEPELTESKDQAPLEFSFNLEPTTSPTVTEQEVKVEETKSGLDFSFTDLELKTPEAETKTEAPIHLDLDFNQPEVKLEEQPVFDKTAFTFEINEPTTAEETQPELITPVSQTAPALSTNDPLMQSFPDLQTMDEAQLNLDLAEQYIELGAYESARVILQTNQSLFNQDQQQYAEKLLNKIAS